MKKKPKGLFDLKTGESYKSPYMAELKKVCARNKMNYLKVLCLLWQSATGKKCRKKKHEQGIYGKELECEAQLVEAVSISAQTFGITKKEAKKHFIKIEKQWKKTNQKELTIK